MLSRHDDNIDTLVTRSHGAEPRREARDESRLCRYFFALHIPVDACQSPPAAVQSDWLVIFESELPVPLEEPEGLADGDEPVEPVEPGDEGEPDDEGADIEPLLEPEPVAPVLPLPPVLLPELPAPELPAPLLEPPAPAPLPAPPPAAPPAAKTSAGVKVIIPIKSRVSIFFIRFLLANESETLALSKED